MTPVVTFIVADSKEMAAGGGGEGVYAKSGSFPFKTRTPYANTSGRVGYFSRPSDLAKQDLTRTFAEFQSQILINETLLTAPDGYYSWILKRMGTGSTLLITGRILSPQEIGTLHINLDMFTTPGQVLYAGELLKRADTIFFNLASGTFVGAEILKKIPLASRRGLKKIEDMSPTFIPDTTLAVTLTRIRDAGIAAFTTALKAIGFTGVNQFAEAGADPRTSFQDQIMGTPLVTPESVVANPAVFDYYAARFNWTPESANTNMGLPVSVIAAGDRVTNTRGQGGGVRHAQSPRTLKRRSSSSRSRGPSGRRVTRRCAQSGRRVQ